MDKLQKNYFNNTVKSYNFEVSNFVVLRTNTILWEVKLTVWWVLFKLDL